MTEREAQDRLVFQLDTHDRGAWFGLVASDETASRLGLRAYADEACRTRGWSFILHDVGPDALPGLAIELLGSSPARTLHWIVLDGPGAPPPDWEIAAGRLLAAMNERRDAYRTRLDGGIVLEGRSSTKRVLRTMAPDLFSVRSFILEPQDPLEMRRRNPLRLDRDVQKALVHRHATELLRSPVRRVEALIAYGSPGAAVGSFSWQACETLESDIVMRRLPLSIPSYQDAVAGSLAAELPAVLGAQPGEPLERTLRRMASPSGRLLWFDYGTYGPQLGQSLRPQDLRGWLDFCQRFLARQCPTHLRILASLSLELPEEAHAQLVELVESWIWMEGLYTERFRALLLPALAPVSTRDVLDFLSNPENTSCPPHLARQMAEVLIRHTQGRYEDVVALLREGEADGFPALLARLMRQNAPS